MLPSPFRSRQLAQTTDPDQTTAKFINSSMRAYLEMPASLEAARFSMWCERIRAIQMNLSESRRFYVEQFQQIEQSKQILIEEAKTFKARSDALQMKELKKSKSPKTAPSKTPRLQPRGVYQKSSLGTLLSETMESLRATRL